MKLLKILSVLTALTALLCCTGVPVLAARDDSIHSSVSSSTYELQPVRAGGGGSSGGGGGGSGGGSSGGHSSTYGRRGYSSPLSRIISLATVALFAFGAAIIFRFRLLKRYCNSRKLIRMLERKDSAWKYKDLEKQVRRAYFLIQNAWANLDMTPAKEVMSPSLFETYQSKLQWMRFRKEQNIMGKIRLLEATPVAVYDNVDDSLDYVWFYITGSMIDYILNTETQMVVRGNTKPEKFGEYWQFVRDPQGNWVLNQILQKDQENLIPLNR